MYNKTILFIAFYVLAYSLNAQNDTTNQTDVNGLRQGYWMKTHQNKNKEAEGYYKDGKQTGKFIYYNLDGKTPKAIIEHVPNSDTTIASYFHENGILMSTGIYVNQKKEGIWKFSDNRKILSSIETYKDDKQHGKTTIYHLNGAVAKEVNVEKGLEQGDFKEFSSNGKPLIEGTYLDGNFNGVIKFYYTNGNLKNQGIYKNAVKDGKWIYYGNEGEIQVEELYINGVLKSRKMSEAMEVKSKELDEERKKQFENGGNTISE